jgi:regulation of enolase protein 1 (concanavalin A-like superfamily)
MTMNPSTGSDSDEYETVICAGFHSLIKNDGILQWFGAPDSWLGNFSAGEEGFGGTWNVVEDGEVTDALLLKIYPPAKKDFWRKTYYEPILLKDDAPILYATLPRDQYFTVEATFSLKAVCQFDQAGICIRFDSEHWLKTGIEVVDRKPRLSCVVTNDYSDWSTQAWPNFQVNDHDQQNIVHVPECQIRVHCRVSSFVVEAKPNGVWEFIRIAHMHSGTRCHAEDPPLSTKTSISQEFTAHGPSPDAHQMWAGIFGACPHDQQGGYVSFRHFQITRGSQFDHTAE